jgi:methylenetetrahydrofolate dehydrogenase (NADP+)/methenyltetrahydrofolate cyclohydrolase
MISGAGIMDGTALAKRIRDEVRDRVCRLRLRGVEPTLATVLVGNHGPSLAYVRAKNKRCDEVSIRTVQVELASIATTNDVVTAVERLAQDASAHGILVQHPVPAPIDRRAVFEAVPLSKDVDGVSSASLGRTILGMPAFVSCTPSGIMRLLKEHDVPLEGVEAVVVGRSAILGRPMASMLINAHATVTLCHSRTRNLNEQVARADVLIVAIGRPRFVQGSWIKPGAVVIDAGYNEGNVGDVDFDAARLRAGWITPVPGGVGPMTIATLLEHTVQAAEEQNAK